MLVSGRVAYLDANKLRKLWEIHCESQFVSQISETSAVFLDFSHEKNPLTFHSIYWLFNKDSYNGLL